MSSQTYLVGEPILTIPQFWTNGGGLPVEANCVEDALGVRSGRIAVQPDTASIAVRMPSLIRSVFLLIMIPFVLPPERDATVGFAAAFFPDGSWARLTSRRSVVRFGNPGSIGPTDCDADLQRSRRRRSRGRLRSHRQRADATRAPGRGSTRELRD